MNITPIELRLDVTTLAKVTDSPAFRSLVNHSGSTRSGDPTMEPNCPPIPNPPNSDPMLPGGQATLAGCTQDTVPAWLPTNDYGPGDRRERNGNAYICTLGGTSGTTGPTGTTPGTVIVDGSAHWSYIGDRKTRSILIYRYETANISNHMPAAGSKMMDPMGDTILRAWVDSLP
jgi:hypothetical protein